MRLLFPLIAILLFVSSCGGSDKKNKVDKAELFGTWEAYAYENPFFNFQLELSDAWNVDSTQFQTTFGGKLFETTFMESVNMDYPVNISMHADKANPFKKASAIDQAKESLEGYDFLFDQSDLIKSPLAKAEVAGEDYVISQIKLLEGSDTSYINEYYRYVGGYYLSIICTSSSVEDDEMVRNFISEIKRLK